MHAVPRRAAAHCDASSCKPDCCHLWKAATPLAAPCSCLSLTAISSAFLFTWQRTRLALGHQSRLSVNCWSCGKEYSREACIGPGFHKQRHHGNSSPAWHNTMQGYCLACADFTGCCCWLSRASPVKPESTSGFAMYSKAACSRRVDSLLIGIGCGPTPALKEASPLQAAQRLDYGSGHHARGLLMPAECLCSVHSHELYIRHPAQ